MTISASNALVFLAQEKLYKYLAQSRAMASSLRAQGATEYLVLAAVVLVIGLVAISLLGFFPGTTGDIQSSSSQAYWASARPTGVYDAKTIESACNSSSRGYSMVLENHEVTLIRFTGISIGGKVMEFCRHGQAPSTEILLDIYKKEAIDVLASIPNSAGKAIRSNISINYVAGSGLVNVQYGSAPLVIANDLPPLSCVSPGLASCASNPCCEGGYCYSGLCYTCGGATEGTCPEGYVCCLEQAPMPHIFTCQAGRRCYTSP